MNIDVTAQAMDALRERCKALHERMEKAAMKPLNDPVETLFSFAVGMFDAGFDRGWNECEVKLAKPLEPTKREDGSDFLALLRAANFARDAEYRAKTDAQALPVMFRTTELAGEVGELLNVIKKIERERLGWSGKKASRDDMLEEFGGVMTCLDLLAMDLGVDLAKTTTAEFNRVTARLGLTTRLPAPASIEASER